MGGLASGTLGTRLGQYPNDWNLVGFRKGRIEIVIGNNRKLAGMGEIDPKWTHS